MSKLFKLMEWLTVPDAARHLSITFGEEVSEADVLRLALDGHLKLSVNFVNHARARRGKVVSWLDTEWWGFQRPSPNDFPKVATPSEPTPPAMARKCPPKLLELLKNIPEDERDDFVPMPRGLNIDGERFLELDEKVTIIKGIWDLPMIGCEEIDIQHLYQQQTGGPAVTLQGLDGAFVEDTDGVICQLQEDFDDNEYQPGSKAQLLELQERIAIEGIEELEAKKLLDKHKQDRKTYLEKRDSQDKSNNYYPAGRLPEDGVLVVRTAALRDFEQSINDAQSNSGKPINTTERNTLLTIIAALCDYSAIVPAERGAASQIVKMSEEIGAPVSDDTIRNVLAKIPDALESRKK